MDTDTPSNHDSDRDAYEQRVRERIPLFLDDFKNGRLLYPKDQIDEVNRQIADIKYNADGQVIVDTVHPSLRAAAMMSQFRRESEQASQIPPSLIQTHLYGLLEDFVEPILGLEGADGHSAQTISDVLAEDPDFIRQCIPVAEEFKELIRNFWDDYGWVMGHHYRDSDHSRALFLGDVFPTDPETTCCRGGILFDQVLLSDPFSKVLYGVGEGVGHKKLVQQLVKHCISAYRIKDFVFADTDIPPVAIVPGAVAWDDNDPTFRWTFEVAKEDAGLHLGRGFGRSFEDLDDFRSWAAGKTVAQLLEAAVRPDMIVTTKSGATDFARGIADQASFMRSAPPLAHLADDPAEVIIMMAMARMGQANEGLDRALRLDAQPLLDVPASFRWLQWKYALDEQRDMDGDGLDWQVITGHKLACLSHDQARFLAGLTVHGLVRARENGALKRIREHIREELSALADGGESDAPAAAEKAIESLSILFSEYSAKLADLAEQLKGTSADAAVTIVNGTIAACAAYTGNPYLGAAAALAMTIEPGGGIRKSWSKYRKIAAEKATLQKTPVGILMRSN